MSKGLKRSLELLFKIPSKVDVEVDETEQVEKINACFSKVIEQYHTLVEMYDKSNQPVAAEAANTIGELLSLAKTGMGNALSNVVALYNEYQENTKSGKLAEFKKWAEARIDHLTSNIVIYASSCCEATLEYINRYINKEEGAKLLTNYLVNPVFIIISKVMSKVADLCSEETAFAQRLVRWMC